MCCVVADATVYVGGLDEKVTEAILWELFLQAGPVGMSLCVCVMCHCVCHGVALCVSYVTLCVCVMCHCVCVCWTA